MLVVYIFPMVNTSPWGYELGGLLYVTNYESRYCYDTHFRVIGGNTVAKANVAEIIEVLI